MSSITRGKDAGKNGDEPDGDPGERNTASDIECIGGAEQHRGKAGVQRMAETERCRRRNHHWE